MNFTKKKPEAPGYYYHRNKQYGAVALYRVHKDRCAQWARRIDLDSPQDLEDVDEMGGHWYGPIALPYPADPTAAPDPEDMP